MSEISQARIHDAAMIAHEANRAYCLTIGDSSQPDWRSAPNWQRDSAIHGAEAIAKDPTTTPEQSHESWSAEKVAAGWVFGEKKDAEAKTHPCLVPYAELPDDQKRKDALFGSVVRAVLGLPQLGGGISFDDHDAVVDAMIDQVTQLEVELAKLRTGGGPADLPNGGRPLADLPDTAPTASEGAES